MHALLFAGGVGQRLWPLSRKNTPKQFAPLVGAKSSFRLAIERLLPMVPAANIHIATNQRYVDLLAQQAPEVPHQNFILEPMRRDLGAATALAFYTLQKRGVSGPLLFQWSDNFVRDDEGFRHAVAVGGELVKANPQCIVFMSEVPRYASENLGYIEHGEELGRALGTPYYAFRSWKYRPAPEECQRMFAAGNFLWNTGFFVTTVEFLTTQFRLVAPEITGLVDQIMAHVGTDQETAKTQAIYPQIPMLHFDEAFLQRLRPDQALMLKVSLGWADPGSLYGLKEALQTADEANVTRGPVVAVQSRDSLVFNEEAGKLVAVMGLEGVMVVNTPEVLLVIPKGAVRHIKTLLEELEKQGHSELL
jgi:mannose-1-phosphate guanylyltransferase